VEESIIKYDALEKKSKKKLRKLMIVFAKLSREFNLIRRKY